MESDGRRNGNDNGSPPLQIVQAYQAMTPVNRKRVRILGGSMTGVAVIVPLVGGLFVELSVAYWIFSGVIALVGVSLVFPQMGMWLISAIPNGITKILPSKMFSRPDRRGDGPPPDIHPPDEPEVPT